MSLGLTHKKQKRKFIIFIITNTLKYYIFTAKTNFREFNFYY
jgi:hypothetical protein